MPTTPPRSPFNRPRWTKEDAREVLAALQRSGKSVSVFAEELRGRLRAERMAHVGLPVWPTDRRRSSSISATRACASWI
jgi:hypothetical protein